MNPIILILLFFAGLGFLDKAGFLSLGLAKPFDQGLASMASLSVSIVGICSVGVTFLERHLDAILPILDHLPFDATLLIGAVLAPDIGGFSICEQLAPNAGLLVLNGVVLTSLLGQTLSFQLPIFLSSIPKEEQTPLMKGCLIGIALVPVGVLTGGILLGLSLPALIEEVLPIGILCLLLFLGLVFLPGVTLPIFSWISRIIQLFTYFLFFLAVVGVFLPTLAYAPLTSVWEAVFTCFQISVIVSGSLVLSELILRYGKVWIQKMASFLSVNETAVIGLLLSCATSLAMVPLFSRMDEKGKLINAAFSVSGAFFLGGQLGYIASVTDSYGVTVYLITKVLCGLLSILVVQLLYGKEKTADQSSREKDNRPS